MRSVTTTLLAALALAAPVAASEVETEPMLDPAANESPADILAGAKTAEAAAAKSDAAPMGYVARSSFTTAVVDREPSDSVEQLSNDETQVAYFTELRDMSGATVTHRWEYDGKVMAEVSFPVGAQRWRAHSRKTLDPELTGTWTVSVIDGCGETVHSESFDYVEAPTVAATEPDAAPTVDTTEPDTTPTTSSVSAPPAAPAAE